MHVAFGFLLGCFFKYAAKPRLPRGRKSLEGLCQPHHRQTPDVWSPDKLLMFTVQQVLDC